MTAKHLTVRKNKANNATATELALMVTSGTELTIEPYDQNAIVKSLKEELGISSESANEIATEVTEKLLLVCNGKTTSVTSSLIRDFINVILYERGNKLSLKSDQSITIPMYDITKTIEMANKENGNLTHCPESINFTLAERLIKEYALHNLFDKEVAKYHREGKIYIHDLGTSNRAYAFDGDLNFVQTKEFGKISISDLYNKNKSKESFLDEKATIVSAINVTVDDGDDSTIINDIVKINEEKDIYEVITESGDTVYITEEHPCLVIRGGELIETPLFDIKEGEDFYVKSE